MAFRRIRDPDHDRREKPRSDKTWSSRIAWGVLVGGGLLIVTRASVATMVTIHGEGMAPTLGDGDGVLVVRGQLSIERGDIVVYDPSPPEPDSNPDPESLPPPLGDEEEAPSPARPGDPTSPLRNTAVVDQDALDSNWERIRARAEDTKPRGYRLGRILALPGDKVTFHVEDGALGLAIEGVPIVHKAAAPLRLGDGAMKAVGYEWAGSTRYTVLPGTGASAGTSGSADPWSVLELPAQGPVQVQAEGYLIVADNRDESACCDSRALGWIPAERIRGEVVLRLASGANPQQRVQWLP